ncbi:UvrD-helicase domain-containing protein [archaeon]|jgi:superfamily I DNA/RNA helicase|nr:UvrD-helicase domain-containing protein [archaeon]
MDENDYLCVLKAVRDMPFGVGRKLLSDFLQGNPKEQIQKHNLFKLSSYGSLAYSDAEIASLISLLERNGFIEFKPIATNKFVKVIQITQKGEKEILNPTLNKVEEVRETKISDEDEVLFQNFSFFLEQYNKGQKKAIVSNKNSILCVAGAGSGKTLVLTKRIEFLTKFKGVKPKEILAITFTRKARREMQNRLKKNEVDGVHVETFNSFCEKILKINNDLIYDKPTRVVTYGDKIRLLRNALATIGCEPEDALDIYFTKSQKNSKNDDQLFNIFLNDCFFILDYFKAENKKVEDFSKDGASTLVYNICKYIEKYMYDQGLRDFTDQIVDCLNFFRGNEDKVPVFKHVLVDEYQDVNALQVELIDRLKSKNLFAVGDPRQAIYGWRGSNVKFILDFEERYGACVINLTKNYRSKRKIVNLFNEAIKEMRLPDLEGVYDGETDIKLLDFENESVEYEFVVQRILNANLERDEIFVLARTNKQLMELSKVFLERGVKHIVKSEDFKSIVEASEGEVTLSTVHAIKGLEAKMVFVVGCNSNNFPCRGSEHPVIEMVKIDDYDKNDEERRLFYVAISRASDFLYLTYSGKRSTSFITPGVTKFIDNIEQKKLDSYSKGYKVNDDLFAKLREWRREVSMKHGVPAYVIFHDSVLEEIAKRKPIDLDDLAEINGMGQVKLRRFGEDVLAVVNS